MSKPYVCGPDGTFRFPLIAMVAHAASGQVKLVYVAVDDIGSGKAPNFLLRPGDQITVPEHTF